MKEDNSFQKDMEDLNEWQQNQYNPGHYIGTGRIQRPILNLAKYPVLLIIAGLVGLTVPIMLLLLTDSAITDILFLFFPPFYLSNRRYLTA
ncbi:hypothetical protein [Natronincola ferrireducens]|uniref:Uncharacterized protein n=1 Tax=Natronincola ferrireducens TaxID=393762 RepID=A0A1G9GZQ8_9FIRM|nr:hypothetical protein [Natronincola ferrireducens]SDL06141.1 hypothetical protein SAMN05660472_02540 [Natronincola ferrireducens]